MLWSSSSSGEIGKLFLVVYWNHSLMEWSSVVPAKRRRLVTPPVTKYRPIAVGRFDRDEHIREKHQTSCPMHTKLNSFSRCVFSMLYHFLSEPLCMDSDRRSSLLVPWERSDA